MTIKLIFQMACILKPECNFLHVPVTSKNGRCGSQGENNARNSHVPEGENVTDHKVQSLKHEAPSLSLPYPRDENVFGTRG